VAVTKADKVNLDALIPRQDLELVRNDQGPSPSASTVIPVSELVVGKLHYQLLRKPSFQRETDDWSVDNVVTLIKSFRDGHLIPAIILWRGETGYTFVIDGAHRLSALIAWVNDDYGDREISRGFYKDRIPKKQQEIAEECRQRVNKDVGSYQSLSTVLNLPNPSAEQIRFASNIAASLVTQTVVGDASMAATSFLAINQRAVQIDPTERYMIEHRDKPNVIAARALVRSARGHQYWKKFSIEVREKIEKKARLIYNAIYEPEDAEAHLNTDLQPAGQAHTANGLRIALDLVNTINEVRGAPEKEDVDGTLTERCIDKTYGVVKYVAGSDPASLSLHPSVYFWGATGNHQPSTFLAVVAFLQDLIARDELIAFTLIRAKFEEFLIGNSALRKEILRRHGGWKKSLGPTKKMLRTLFEGLHSNKSFDEIERDILQLDSQAAEIDLIAVDKTTWRETKSSLRRQASLDAALRCPICKARLVLAHASDDHKHRRTDGGGSDVSNAQLTHQFCNTGFKEHFAQRGQPTPDIPIPQ